MMNNTKPQSFVLALGLAACCLALSTGCGEPETQAPYMPLSSVGEEDPGDQVQTDRDILVSADGLPSHRQLERRPSGLEGISYAFGEDPVQKFVELKNAEELAERPGPVYRPRSVNYFFREITIEDVDGSEVYQGDEEVFWTGSLKLDQRFEYRVEFVKIDVTQGIVDRQRFEGRYLYDGQTIHFMDEEDKLRFSMDYHYYAVGDQLWLDRTGLEQVLDGPEEFVEAYLEATRD